jgi:CRISPR/Cas system-associated exonuclease Cas4 (RecB family)
MSASQLAQIELCPLRWALKRGSYPDFWNRRGYPVPFHAGSFNGQVLHLALERIGNAMSLGEATLIGTLRQLGGLSAIIKHCMEEMLGVVRANPRIRNGSRLEEQVQSQLPLLRERLQILLGSVTSIAGRHATSDSKVEADRRQPLANGSHFEVEVKSDKLRWTGRIDAIQISEDSIEIFDYKTGEIQDRDSLQVQIYALLWSHDRELNPTRRLANKLHLLSPNGNISLPGPATEQLRSLEIELKSRSEAALSILSAAPPPARANSECPDCDVRHLCELYWSSLEPTPPDQARRGLPQTIDAQVVLKSRVGENVWNAEVQKTNVSSLSKVFLRNSYSDPGLTHLLETGRQFRILNAWLVSSGDRESSSSVLSLTDRSELFILP